MAKRSCQRTRAFQPQCDDLRPPHCGMDKPVREFPPVPVAWTRTMAQFIRSIDSNHLIISGSYVHSGDELQVEELDLMGGTYYYSDTSSLVKDVAVLQGQRPFLVKEFGLAGSSNFAVVNQTVELITASPAVAGGLYWSLRGHARVRQCDWALACARFVTCCLNPEALDVAGLIFYAHTLTCFVCVLLGWRVLLALRKAV